MSILWTLFVVIVGWCIGGAWGSTIAFVIFALPVLYHNMKKWEYEHSPERLQQKAEEARKQKEEEEERRRLREISKRDYDFRIWFGRLPHDLQSQYIYYYILENGTPEEQEYIKKTTPWNFVVTFDVTFMDDYLWDKWENKYKTCHHIPGSPDQKHWYKYDWLPMNHIEHRYYDEFNFYWEDSLRLNPHANEYLWNAIQPETLRKYGMKVDKSYKPVLRIKN